MAKNDYSKIEKDEEAFQKFLTNFVKNSLRRASYRWPYRNIAKNNSKIERGFYRCQVCQQAFGPKEINLDHINPVVDVKTGFRSWDDFINRLFVKSHEFQVLCEMDHSLKTAIENEMRRKNGQKEIKHKKKKKQ